ncbi:MAG: type VII secretion-associated protein [Mycobacterium sp.]|nr:type VII secretion-associated protein [Mycobacterium sp.]
MSAHVIEVGPSAICHLCCGGTTGADNETTRAAFDSIDDPVGLLDVQPVTADSLWRAALLSVDCESLDCAIVVHPSWWASTRVDVISGAAQFLADDVVIRPRSWLLAQAARRRCRPPGRSEEELGNWNKASLGSVDAAVVVEITDRFVVISGVFVVAEPRRGEPERTARELVRSIVEMALDTDGVVVIDAPSTVGGAGALARMIADELRVSHGMAVVEVDDVRLRELAAAEVSSIDDVSESNYVGAVGNNHRHRRWLALVVLLIIALLGVNAWGRDPAPEADRVPTTFLVEGRVALEVPAQWPTHRVIAGPGSARVQVTSPSDPEVALLVTQSWVAAETLGAAAESLKHAIDVEPAGVFVDFNPTGLSAGRPAVTYREVRTDHDIRWSVLLDGAVRISIGCQSRPGDDDATREVCERAVRSARALS